MGACPKLRRGDVQPLIKERAHVCHVDGDPDEPVLQPAPVEHVLRDEADRGGAGIRDLGGGVGVRVQGGGDDRRAGHRGHRQRQDAAGGHPGDQGSGVGGAVPRPAEPAHHAEHQVHDLQPEVGVQRRAEKQHYEDQVVGDAEREGPDVAARGQQHTRRSGAESHNFGPVLCQPFPHGPHV
jgi:hypothetical protein